MKLWLLRPVEGLAKNDNPWHPWFDKAFGFVIRAETETDARKLANANAGDENEIPLVQFVSGISDVKEPWLNSKYSTCVELTAEGTNEVVIKDFHAA